MVERAEYVLSTNQRLQNSMKWVEEKKKERTKCKSHFNFRFALFFICNVRKAGREK